MWKVSTCNCSICQIKVRGNIFLCIGAFSRQGAGYARANETASASPKSSLEKQLANRPGRRNTTGKKTRRTARKQDGAYCARHDYKTPSGKQEVRCHYIVTMQSIGGSIQRTLHNPAARGQRLQCAHENHFRKCSNPARKTNLRIQQSKDVVQAKKQGGKRENRHGLSHKNDNKTMQNRTFECSYGVTM